MARPPSLMRYGNDDAFAVHGADEKRVREALHVVPPQIETLRSFALDAARTRSALSEASALHERIDEFASEPFAVLLVPLSSCAGVGSGLAQQQQRISDG